MTAKKKAWPTSPDDIKETDLYFSNVETAAAVERFFEGPADLDPYGDQRQLVKARKIFTAQDPFPGEVPHATQTLYVNPPFSLAPTIVPNLARISYEQRVETVMLCPAAVGSKYWADWVWGAPHITAIGWAKRFSFYEVRDGQVLPAVAKTGKAAGKVQSIRIDCAFLYFSPYIMDGPEGFQKTHERTLQFAEAFRPICRQITQTRVV